VSDVAFSPNPATPVAVSCGWDRLVKVWSLGEDFKLKYNLTGATGYLNTVCVSPEGSLCAAAGKEGTIFIYDLKEGKPMYKLEAGCEVYQLVFNPTKYWLCAATKDGVKVFDLEKKACIAELTRANPDFMTTAKNVSCISVAWSADSNTIFAGYTDNIIRVWEYSE
jgi:guanine nucleotide-binding protein subunit beta-2-like 1 protein